MTAGSGQRKRQERRLPVQQMVVLGVYNEESNKKVALHNVLTSRLQLWRALESLWLLREAMENPFTSRDDSNSNVLPGPSSHICRR